MEELFDRLDNAGAETDEAIERFMDDEEMYAEYVNGFPAEPTMPALKAAVAARDYPAAQRAVHALKGISSNLGFIPLTDACVDMLADLRADDITAALTAYTEVETQYDRFCGAIRG